MKRILIAVIMFGLMAVLPSIAKAEYAVSFRFGDFERYDRFEHGRYKTSHQKYKNRCAYPRWGYGHAYPHWSLFYGSPYYPQTTVIRTYDVRPEEKAQYSKEKLGISDIIVLSKAGVDDHVIIEKIVKTGSVFYLSVEEVDALQREGVSNNVINFMLSTTKKK